MAQTLYDKLWNTHVIHTEEDGTTILYIDRHLLHEVTSPQAFEGLKLAERGGRNGKKRAIIARARKLAVLLHHLWVSGEVYEPLHNSQPASLPAAA